MQKPQKPVVARPIFRWLAMFTVPVFIAVTVSATFGITELNGEPNYFVAGLFAWGAIAFGSIAATAGSNLIRANGVFSLLLLRGNMSRMKLHWRNTVCGPKK